MGSERLQTLRAVSERIRDPANHGEVLKLVLKFVAESASRVAMFMVRDEIAVGVAQIGLPRGGGPDDARFREIELPAAEVEWFRHVLQTRTSLCSPATGDGDRALARRIGDREPAQAYVAPILSGGRVVAILYADNLPGVEPMGDTSVIEIALHEAGLALERALLQRALAQIGDPSAL
jgi:GAF domain-containing protein